MSNIEALKEQARRYEQKEEWEKACESYLQAIERLDEEEQPDIGLYNRVGDILIRVGDYERAIQNFDRATELYLEAELPNNAIAVCKKVIRHLPNRHEIHLRIGKIRASQGFILDARESFLTYADRMQKEGEKEKALEALVEFVELAPDDTEARMSVATQLLQHERTEEALEQLKAGYRASRAQDDQVSVKAFGDKLHELAPSLDLEALGDEAGPGTDGFAFESADLGFGELDAGLDDPTATGEAATGEPSEVEADFGDIVISDGEDDGGTEGDDLTEAADASAAEAAPDAGPGAFEDISLDEDQELPFLAEFGSAVDEGDEEGEPLPFLSVDEDDNDDWATALEGAHDEAPGTPDATPSPAPADEGFTLDPGPLSGLEAAASQWETLRRRCQEQPSDGDAAKELVELAFKLDDQAALVESYLVLAGALRASGSGDHARSVIEQALSLDPGNAQARAWLRESEPAPALEAEEASASGDFVDLGALIFDDEPTEKTTRFRVAYQEPSGDEEADFAEMLNQFKAKVAENFDAADVKAHHDLGTAYKEMGLLDEAVEKFQEALRASPVHLPTYELLGQTFMERGEPAAAVRVLERALKVGSEVEDEFLGIYYYLGRAHEELEQPRQAVEYYDRVFALDINFSDVTERLRRLR